MFLSLIIVMGYTAVHGVLWEMAYGTTQKVSGGVRSAVRVIIPLWALVVLFTLSYAMYIDPMNDVFYRNLQLVFVCIQVMDDNLDLFSYVVRVGVVYVFLFLSFLGGAVSLPLLVLNGVTILLASVVTRWRRGWLNDSYLLVGLILIMLACVFWLPQTHVALANRLAIMVTYLAMATYVFIHWHSMRNRDNRMRMLRQRADIDSLTQVKTYSRFHDDVAAMVTDAQERQTALTMVMLDIDHFKSVNDEYGHPSGNDVLVGVSSLLDDVLAQHAGMHQIYRTGGEEFNIVFQDAKPQDVIAIVEDCWRQVREHDFVVGGQHIQVTISVGVTALRPGEGYEETFKRADNNLYMSKRHGRDTITVDGVTEQLGDRQIAMFTYSYYTQAIVDMQTGVTVRNELLLRTFDETMNQWRLPDNFDISPATQIDLLRRTLGQLEVPAMSVNLRQDQFTNLRMANSLISFAHQNEMSAPLVVELTDLPPLALMERYSELYHNAGIQLYIDDIESEQSFATARPYLPFVDGVKFVLQNARRDSEGTALHKRVVSWQQEAKQYGVNFVLEGVESAADAEKGLSLGITLGEGYYYSRPALPYLR
ncbi:sensor domain-containing diguanylate cyclase [Lacticaseibacillus zhaodongensis]|uniref:sensor domain-containing diguanylate cyclase n=1 Tax=Lacticaseibacillus zhaodongensis TaxID=2668065 RepID=UPI0012D34673|nr:diguanylate cyclase [Lacticaseibacillus zhaodongensis]